MSEPFALLARARSRVLTPLTSPAIEGPYYLADVQERSDLRDGQAGRLLRLNFQVVDGYDGAPIRDAVVSVWHCNPAGLYSGYTHRDPLAMPERIKHVDHVGDERFLRGKQRTDEEGVVIFDTIFPGWYATRAVHIHLKVFVREQELITTQAYFPQMIINSVLAGDGYAERGNAPWTTDIDPFYRQSFGLTNTALTVSEEGGVLVGEMTIALSHS